jgi:hypothetical protein
MYQIRIRRALSAIVLSIPVLLLVMLYVALRTDYRAGGAFYVSLSSLSLLATFLQTAFFFRSAPLWQAYEPRMVLAADVLAGAVGAFVAVAVCGGVALVSDADLSLLRLVACGGGIGTIAVAMAHAGIALTDSPEGTRLERVVKQYVVGTTLGAAALFTLTAAWRWMAEMDSTEIEAVRIAGVIAISGLAAATAGSSQGRGAFRNVPWARRATGIASALLLGVVGAVVYPFVAGRAAGFESRGVQERDFITAQAGQPLIQEGTIMANETRLRIDAKFAQSVAVSFGRDSAAGSIQLNACDGGTAGSPSIGESSTSILSGILGVGCYQAVLTPQVGEYNDLGVVLDFLAEGDAGDEWRVTVNQLMTGPVEGAWPPDARSGSLRIKPKLENPETTVSVDLEATRRVSASVVRDGEFIDDAASNRESRATNQPRIEGRESDGRPVSKLGANGSVEETLQPGRYTIAIPGALEPIASESLLIEVGAIGGDTIKMLSREGVDSEVTWAIDTVPAERTFRVEEPVAVRIELERAGRDLVVLLEADGTQIARADDPEVIQTPLAPGTYVVRAEAYSGESVSLPSPTTLVIRASQQ